MVALARSGTVIQINQTLSTTVDHPQQYRELVYEWIETLRLAGWTVIRSSNGTVATDADNIASASDIVFGTATDPRSWAVLAPPAVFFGKGGSVAAGETLRLLIACVATGANPQNVVVSYVTNNGSYPAGSTTATPTASGGTESASIGASYQSTWVPWTTAQNARWARWYNALGEVRFAIKTFGEIGFRHMFEARTFTDADEGEGDNRPMFFGYSAASEGGIQSSSYYNQSYTRARNKAGTAELVSITPTSPGWLCSSWTNGAEQDRGVPATGMVVINNSGGSSARHHGWLRDVYGAPTSAPNNEVQDGDTDTIRLFLLGGNSAGKIWLPANAADLPLE